MKKIKKILNKIENLFEIKHICPKCKIELDCYGSHPWGYFTYECDKCGYKETKNEER